MDKLGVRMSNSLIYTDRSGPVALPIGAKPN